MVMFVGSGIWCLGQGNILILPVIEKTLVRTMYVLKLVCRVKIDDVMKLLGLQSATYQLIKANSVHYMGMLLDLMATMP